MRRAEANRLARIRLRKLGPIPTSDPNGMWMRNPETGLEEYVLFSMSQCSSWSEMQPIFAKLKTFTDQRMIDESNRIKTLLIPEMQKAYR